MRLRPLALSNITMILLSASMKVIVRSHALGTRSSSALIVRTMILSGSTEELVIGKVSWHFQKTLPVIVPVTPCGVTLSSCRLSVNLLLRGAAIWFPVP
jgi:hypothetical protein